MVQGRQGPCIGMRGNKHCSVENNYNHNLSLIQTLPNSTTRFPPQPHVNDSIAESGCTGNYLYDLKKIFLTRDISENPINVKLSNSSTMESTHQAHIPLKNYLSKKNM